MSTPLRTAFAALLALCPLAAQIPSGHAAVAWKPSNPTATGGIKLVDRAGVARDLTGLSAATLGTTRFDGAQSVAVSSIGELFVGLGVDNRTGTTPLPLEVRRILVSGTTAILDQPLATVHTVPAGELWKVSDLQVRGDGSLLVAATEILANANPMPKTLACLVLPGGTVVNLAAVSQFPAGSLVAVADLGTRFAAAFLQSFFVVNLEVMSFTYDSVPAGFRVHQFVSVPRIAALGADANGELLLAGQLPTPAGQSSLVRLPHAPGATPVAVTGGPTAVAAADFVAPAAVAAVFTPPTLIAGSLQLVDMLAGQGSMWAQTVVRDPVDIALRQSPAHYGLASGNGPGLAWLGTDGGLPAVGNGLFGLRVGGTTGSQGVILASIGRGSVPTPFGTILLDLSVMAQVAGYTVPNTGALRLGLPLPNNPSLIGQAVTFQALAIASASPLLAECSRGLELVFL